MSFHIDHHPNALLDVQKVYRWYKRRSLGAAQGFLIQMDKALDRVQQNPLQYGAYHSNTRACVLKKYPYIIVYRLYANSVTIFAVTHTKRKQQHWRKRLT